MKDSRRVCYTCGKKYHYCSHCPEYRNKPEWMNITCCEECHDLYVVCANFNLGKYSKEEAQALLSKYDLSQISISRPNMIHTLQKIYDQEEAATPIVIEVSEVKEEVPEDNNEDVEKVEVSETDDAVAATDADKSEDSDEAAQPKSRRRKKTLAVLDELDE